MLVVGPDGGLIEVQPFQGAAINLFQKLGAKRFSLDPVPALPRGASLALVGFDRWYDAAFGRSPDEALLRLIKLVCEKTVTCANCKRQIYVDDENVVAPLDPIQRDYLFDGTDGDQWATNDGKAAHASCTMYFDGRVAEWKQSCSRFDPHLEPTQESPTWNRAPAAQLTVPSGPDVSSNAASSQSPRSSSSAGTASSSGKPDSSPATGPGTPTETPH